MFWEFYDYCFLYGCTYEGLQNSKRKCFVLTSFRLKKNHQFRSKMCILRTCYLINFEFNSYENLSHDLEKDLAKKSTGIEKKNVKPLQVN